MRSTEWIRREEEEKKKKKEDLSKLKEDDPGYDKINAGVNADCASITE